MISIGKTKRTATHSGVGEKSGVREIETGKKSLKVDGAKITVGSRETETEKSKKVGTERIKEMGRENSEKVEMETKKWNIVGTRFAESVVAEP